MKKRTKPVIDDSKVNRVKEYLKSGDSIHGAARSAGVSYYTAWKVSRGIYDLPKSERQPATDGQEETGYFSWKNFKLY
jgi:molybdenum-dependent DNA-binding transcriptional regulator ModE